MVREGLESIPEAALPAGYSFRLYREGDESHWADIETLASEFPEREAALTRFRQEFCPYLDEMKRRCLFVVSPVGRYVGTTTAWYGDTLGDGVQGRIHWVAVIPEEQGSKLAKPLLSEALRVMAALGHERAYLTTQTTSWKAVNMYLQYGFKPHVRGELCREGWSLIEEQLGRPVLT
ncbi:GNAT family N-acetyltransferase [Paenibacillus koleovorans]|uniref:GNAT family N-acetyltransferase n=1 Tax=Paenibacillus koleovorans TaxID=121608 RepID=UPI001FE81516|nr:GNAT family N-acetyltransferase [Paenibacillus koleovorans]